jgi:hypothetical protein
MGRVGKWLAIATLVAGATEGSFAAPFVLFPKAGELRSPDGRFLVRNVERAASATEFAGTAHSLWLIEVSTQRAHKLCDYLGVAAVGWSDNKFVVITEYVAKKTSRAWVFPVAEFRDAVVFDKPSLIHMLPVQFRESLRENDHVFIEASRVEDGILQLNVWGYGKHDAHGFRWACIYDLRERSIECGEHSASR